MTPELITAIVAIITALIVSYNNHRSNERLKVTVKKDSREIKETLKADGAAKDEQLKEIHVLVDGRLSEAISEIAELKERLALLTGTKADKALSLQANKNVVSDDAVIKGLDDHIEKVEELKARND